MKKITILFCLLVVTIFFLGCSNEAEKPAIERDQYQNYKGGIIVKYTEWLDREHKNFIEFEDFRMDGHLFCFAVGRFDGTNRIYSRMVTIKAVDKVTPEGNTGVILPLYSKAAEAYQEMYDDVRRRFLAQPLEDGNKNTKIYPENLRAIRPPMVQSFSDWLNEYQYQGEAAIKAQARGNHVAYEDHTFQQRETADYLIAAYEFLNWKELMAIYKKEGRPIAIGGTVMDWESIANQIRDIARVKESGLQLRETFEDYLYEVPFMADDSLLAFHMYANDENLRQHKESYKKDLEMRGLNFGGVSWMVDGAMISDDLAGSSTDE